MNLLVLSAWFPFPADNGSKIRTQHLLRALAKTHTVDLASFYQCQRELAALKEAQEICHDVSAFPKPPFDADRLPSLTDLFSPLPRFVRTTFSPPLAQKVKEWRCERRYDAIVCMTWGMVPYAEPLTSSELLPRNPESATPRPAKSVLDQHNIESGIFRRGLRLKRGMGRLRGWLTYRKFRRFEGRTCASFSACSVVSEEEREELHKILPRAAKVNIATIPNGVDTAWLKPCWRRFSQGPRPRRDLLFTGSLSYGANVDGLRWFLQKVYPRLKASFPDLTLRVSGDPLPEALPEAKDDPSVIFTGYLPDLRPLLWESAALVVPLRLGGGTRLKILEAMAAGLPVISTRAGAEGIEAQPVQHLLIAQEPEEFVTAAGRVFNQPLRTFAMAARARKLVEERYDWASIGRAFNRLVEETLNEKPACD